jgi:uncharacterized protein (DUF2141 family)
MASISVCGITCAALIAASAPSIARAADVEVQVQQLRNGRGMVRLCLTRNPAHFPDCNRDPAAVKRSVAAGQAGSIRLAGVAEGVYALAVVHDENGNGRLDRFMAIPREGFGFSRNPQIRMGPPSFEEARFAVGAAGIRQVVRMKYLL